MGRTVIMTVGTAVYLILMMRLLLTAARGLPRYLAAKMAASGTFVVLGIVFALAAGHGFFLAWMLPALLLCFLGDFFIGLFRKSRNSRHFMLGLIFFLAAHLAFSFFLLAMHPGIDVFNIGIPLAVGVIFLLLERFCGLNMRKLRWPAFFYAFFLSFFMVNALKFAFDARNTGALWIGAGSALFFASDVSIIFLYFHTFRRTENKTAVHIFNLTTYYLGILGILIGVGTL